MPDGHFEHINIDIIGSMPGSRGFRYCVMVIDRFSRWPEAYPVSDISAETVANVLCNEWISRYDGPVKITTDQGRQFESDLFRVLNYTFGILIYAYHTLQSTGERVD